MAVRNHSRYAAEAADTEINTKIDIDDETGHFHKLMTDWGNARQRRIVKWAID